MMNLIPMSRSWLKVIIISRPIKIITDWSKIWDIENGRNIDLEILDKEESKELLFEMSEEFNIEFSKDDLMDIIRLAQGNPLFIKLFCKSVESDKNFLTNKSKWPKEIEGIYEYNINKIVENVENKDLTQLLCLLAHSKSPLSFSMITFNQCFICTPYNLLI